MSDVRVYEPTEITPALLAAMRSLVPLLSSSAPPLTETSLAAIVASPGSRLLVAERDGAIIGTLTLVLFAIPSGVRGLIEDVIVDARARTRRRRGPHPRGPRPRAHGGSAHRRPHVAPHARGRQQALPARRLRAPRDQRLPLHALSAMRLCGSTITLRDTSAR